MTVTTCQDTHYYPKEFSRESIGIKSHFFTPALPEEKPAGQKWRWLPPHIQPLGGLGGKPRSRSSLEEQAVCPLKDPWSYLRSCRPDNTSRLSLEQVSVSELTIELVGRWDVREEFNSGEFWTDIPERGDRSLLLDRVDRVYCTFLHIPVFS